MSTAYVVIMIKHLTGKVTLRNINSKFCTFINNVSFVLLLLFHFSSTIFQKTTAQNIYVPNLCNFNHFIIIILFYYFLLLLLLSFIILLFIGQKLSHCDIYPSSA